MRSRTAVHWYLLLVLPAIFLLISLAHLYTFFHQRSDIWWTPRSTLVPLPESHDRAAIYVRGGELDDLVAARRLWIRGDSAQTVVAPTDIGLRLNHWDRVRAEQIPGLLTYAASAGAAAALLLVGILLTAVDRRTG